MDRQDEIRQVAARLLDIGQTAESRGMQQWAQADTMVDLVRAFNVQADELSSQLEIKDRQIQEKDRQLEERSREVAQLHDMLMRAQSLSLSLTSSRRRAWWRRVFGGARK